MFFGVFIWIRKPRWVIDKSGVFERYITSLGNVDFIEKRGEKLGSITEVKT